MGRTVLASPHLFSSRLSKSLACPLPKIFVSASLLARIIKGFECNHMRSSQEVRLQPCNLQCQAMATHLLNEVFRCSSPPTMPPPQPLLQPQPPPPPPQQQPEKKPRPQPEQAVRCPRCDSTNTKFCYYNNYSLAQPRYFCKGCRRYWTKGGTLRNVPVGGGCRKNKRPSFSSKKAYEQSLATTSGAALHPLPPPPALAYGPSDLTLAFPGLAKASAESKIGLEDRDSFLLESPAANAVSPHVPGFLEILKTGFLDSSTAVFNSFCFGLGGHGNPQEVEGAVGIQPSVPPFEGVGGATTAAIKQESSYQGVDEDNRLFMGLQWPAGEAGNTVVDPIREYWSGVGSTTWHGLVHSSLF